MEQVWFNGKLLPAGQATIGIDDQSFLRGWGVFETMLGVDERIPLWDRHWQRISLSASTLGLPHMDRKFIEAGLDAVLSAKTQEGDSGDIGPRLQRVRLTVSAGAASTMLHGGSWADHQGSPTVLITAGKLSAERLGQAAPGLRLMVSPYRMHSQSATAGHKVTSYANHLLIKRAAFAAGFDDALILNEAEHVVEISSANIFFVKNNRLATPPLSSGCLPGIMRQLVIQTADELGIVVEQLPIDHQHILGASAAFATSATSIIAMIAKIDDAEVEGKVFSGEPTHWLEVLKEKIRSQVLGF